MEIKKILKLKMIKKLPFNNNNLINKKFQKILKISINFHNRRIQAASATV